MLDMAGINVRKENAEKRNESKKTC